MWFWFTATRGRNKQWFWVGSKHMIMQWQQQRVDKKVREDLPLHMNPQWINEWLYGFVMVLTLLHITPHLIFLCYVESYLHYTIKLLCLRKIIKTNFWLPQMYHEVIIISNVNKRIYRYIKIIFYILNVYGFCTLI